MRISDKQLGYLTILVILTSILCVSYLMYVKNSSTHSTLTLIFDDVGSLQPQDPVTKQGLVVGSVTSITYENRQAIVVVCFDDPILLRDSTRFINYNFSLMGERRIKIIPSTKGNYIQPNQHIRGEFEPGISEAMHKMQFIIVKLNQIHQFLVLLNKGSRTESPLYTKINNELNKTEQMLNFLSTSLDTYHPQLIATLDQVSDLSNQSIALINSFDTIITDLHAQASSLVTQSGTVINSALVATEKLRNHIETVHSFGVFQNDSLFQSISELTNILNATIKTIQMSGLSLSDTDGKKIGLVRLSNFNIFGQTAREKRAQKTKESEK